MKVIKITAIIFLFFLIASGCANENVQIKFDVDSNLRYCQPGSTYFN